ncbi:hypothetical protein BH10CYA1_BH10CYA1_32500 [soil metagenome]
MNIEVKTMIAVVIFMSFVFSLQIGAYRFRRLVQSAKSAKSNHPNGSICSVAKNPPHVETLRWSDR